jgi:hypothetical protein
MGFRSLQHMKDRRSTCRGLCLPATFRLQGLDTLLTAYSLQPRAGFLSTRQRSWDYPFGAFSSGKVPRRFHLDAPTYRLLPRTCPLRRGGGAGLAGRGFWASTLPGVPGGPAWF